MGFEVVAIDRGDDRANLSKSWRVSLFEQLRSRRRKELQKLGGAQVCCHASGARHGRCLGGCRRGGVVISSVRR